MEDIDIYRSAKLYIDQYGVDASVQAGMTADAIAVLLFLIVIT